MSAARCMSGEQVVTYWREMLLNSPDYAPSCDHDNGVSVIAYIDGLLSKIAAAEVDAERLRGTIQFNREELDRRLAALRAEHRAHLNDLILAGAVAVTPEPPKAGG